MSATSLPDKMDLLEQIGSGRVEADDTDDSKLLDRHGQEAALAASLGRPGREAIAPFLLGRIADTRTLRASLNRIGLQSIQVAGPNGITHIMLRPQDREDLRASLREAIVSGDYWPGPERVIPISRGRGRRKLNYIVQNIADTVIQDAAALVIWPLLAPFLKNPWTGDLPGNPIHAALAVAERSYVQGRRIWVTATLSDPLRHIQLPLLLDTLKKYVLADDVVALVDRISGGATVPGLRTGASLSYTLRALFLHHLVDRPLRRSHPDVPVLRVGLDVLALCSSADEAHAAKRSLEQSSKAAGLPLEGGGAHVSDLTPDQPASWGHFNVAWSQQGMIVSVNERAFADLETRIKIERIDPNNGAGVVKAIEGWTRDLGPCPHDLAGNVHQRLKLMLRKMRFRFVPHKRSFVAWWEEAHAAWEETRRVCANA